MQFLIIDFPQNVCGYGYYIISLLCGNYASLHCSMLVVLRLLCILQGILTGEIIRLLFHQINRQLTLRRRTSGMREGSRVR